MTSLRSARPSWLATPPPSVGVEITSRHVAAVALSPGVSGAAVSAYALEPLPAGALVPSLAQTNIIDPAAVAAAVSGAIARLGVRSRRIALVIPDSAAKVSLVRFDSVPARAEDLDRLVRWQVRRTVPFRIEDAQVAWTPGARIGDQGRELIVAAVRHDIVAEYEGACAAAGAHAGVVDLATFNLINAALAASQPAGDWLLVHLAAEYVTLAILRDEDLMFFRNRAGAGDGSLADLVHQTTMYYEDRLGGFGFTRVILAGAGQGGQGDHEATRRDLEMRLQVPVEPIDARAAAGLTGRISASRDLLEALASPVGIVLRGRMA